MKILTIVLFLSILAGCSVHQVKSLEEEEYCSPRALKHLSDEPTRDIKIQSKMEKGQADKKGQILQEIMKKLSVEGKKCFQESLDKKVVSIDRSVCLVLSTSEKGSLSFLDFEDNSEPIPPEFHKCLENVFGNADYKAVPSVTVKQLFRFYIKSK
jgi:hypothetical protein